MTALFSDGGLVRTYDEGPLTLTRPAAAQDESGGWGETTSTVTLSPVAVHPHVDRNTLESAPEADRRTRQIRIYALQELREGDRLLWRGEHYRIYRVEPVDSNAESWEALAALVDPGDPRA